MLSGWRRSTIVYGSGSQADIFRNLANYRIRALLYARQAQLGPTRHGHSPLKPDEPVYNPSMKPTRPVGTVGSRSEVGT